MWNAKSVRITMLMKIRRVIDMTIDEVIEQFKYDAECNRADLDLSYAEDNEQVAEWLEELKAIKSDGFTDDLLNMGFTKGYNKALYDFVKFANTMPTVEEDDGTIRPMWLEEMAERLKGEYNE